MNRLPDRFIFMKVGMHANESLPDILKRKSREFKRAGMIFWGYGGSLCHPVNQVHPFVRSTLEVGTDDVYLVMEPIVSRANPRIAPATQYSVDGKTWEPIPKGITVTGSKFALVLDEIQPAALTFDPREYAVGVGACVGRNASDYIGARVDKGCFTRAEQPSQALRGRTHRIELVAKLKAPYAVHVRG